MDVSNLGSRRKIVHVWDVFGDKNEKDKTPKHKSMATPKKELFPVKESGIYLADGVSHGVKNQRSPGRKKRQAPKPPGDSGLHEMGASYDSGTGLKEISNLDHACYENTKCNNLLNKSALEYDPVTGLKMSNSDVSEELSSHGFIFGKELSQKGKEYLSDLNSPTESLDDPFGLTTSNASKISTRASSGYFSDGDLKDSFREQVSKGSPSYPDIEELDAETEMNNNEKEDKVEEVSFEEDEMTMSFDEEDEDVEGRETKLYQEYAGEDFSVFIQDDAGVKKTKKKVKRKTKPKNKTAGDSIVKTGTGDPASSVYKGTLLGITRNFGNKNTLSSFDKLSNFSFADSKIGSIKPDSKSHIKDMKGHWWDINNMHPHMPSGEKNLVKKEKAKEWDNAVIPENEFSVYSYDQRAVGHST